MKKLYYLLLAFAISSVCVAQNLNLKDITAGKLGARSARAVVSSNDGEHYFQTDLGSSKIIKYSYKTGLPTDTLFDTAKAIDCTFTSFQGFLISPDEKRLVVYNNKEDIYRHSFKADYYYVDVRRNLIRKLTENKSKQMCPVFSKDGRMMAYVADNNIWLSKFDYGSESQITKDGSFGKIINGSTDWVYEEEFGTTSLMEFSPDNNLLAFVKFDETAVPEFSFQNFEGKLYPSLTSFKYPKAGEPNSKVSCNIFDIDSKTIRKVSFPGNTEIEYIPKIKFAPNSQLAIFTLNRDQNDFNLFAADPRTTIAKLILREQNDKYIDSELFEAVNFMGDSFTYLSEKDGYSHIYLYSLTGTMQKQLTSGNYDVTNILACDAASKTIYYQSAEESPLQRAIYKVDITKSTKTKLSIKQGTNAAQFSSNGKYYINTWSDINTPNLSTVNDANGKEIRVLEDNKDLKEKLAGMKLPQKEFITLKAADGSNLNAWIMKPADFKPSVKYPLIMVQYSGPNSQQVLNRFGIGWENYAASQGFIVACVDGRGTGARGQDFRKCTYMNLGIIESDDQIAAAKQLASLAYVDSADISIWGWSYGGFNTLMCLSRSQGVFKSGVAIAPVTNWKYYDSVYTERFMRTPQQNAMAYSNGSPITLASNLSGKLLLIHGTADDNVHYQNSMDYAEALIKADKQFEMFMFPDQNHSIPSYRAYLYQKVIDFLKRR